MNNLITYLIQSGMCLAIMYLIYSLLLHRDTFFALNRTYLLISAIVSLLFPLINFNIGSTADQPITIFLEPVIVVQDSLKHSLTGHIGISQFLLVLYISGAAFVFLRFFFRLAQIIRLAKKYGISEQEGFMRVNISSDYTPFSFFNVLFICNDIPDRTQLEKIIAHELVHIRQKHSFDLILFEIITMVQWFNPFVWLFRRAIKNLHEFQADNAVLMTGTDRREYQELLLNQTFGLQLNVLTNNFNNSLIKTRFKMMTRTKSKKAAMLKMIFIIPAAVAIMLLLSFSVSDNALAHTEALIMKAETSQQPVKQDQKKDEVFTVVEVMPQYPGGSDAMIQFIAENVKYPENARKEGKQGTVYVTFIIEKDGKVSEAKVLRGFNKDCDDEAVRVVNLMPDWKPGMQKGKAVRTQFNLPVKFKLAPKAE